MSKKFLSVGDTLINPDLLAYAVVDEDVDGPSLRLGFAAQTGGGRDLRVHGEAAREILRWLRLNADFLSKQGPFSPNAPARRVDREFHRIDLVDGHASLDPLAPALGRSPELVGRY